MRQAGNLKIFQIIIVEDYVAILQIILWEIAYRFCLYTLEEFSLAMLPLQVLTQISLFECHSAFLLKPVIFSSS